MTSSIPHTSRGPVLFGVRDGEIIWPTRSQPYADAMPAPTLPPPNNTGLIFDATHSTRGFARYEQNNIANNLAVIDQDYGVCADPAGSGKLVAWCDSAGGKTNTNEFARSSMLTRRWVYPALRNDGWGNYATYASYYIDPVTTMNSSGDWCSIQGFHGPPFIGPSSTGLMVTYDPTTNSHYIRMGNVEGRVPKTTTVPVGQWFQVLTLFRYSTAEEGGWADFYINRTSGVNTGWERIPIEGGFRKPFSLISDEEGNAWLTDKTRGPSYASWGCYGNRRAIIYCDEFRVGTTVKSVMPTEWIGSVAGVEPDKLWAPVSEPAPEPTTSTPISYRRGVVLAGGEFSDNGSYGEEPGAAGGLTYTNPGTYGDDYLYPAAGDFTYLKTRMTRDPIAKVMTRMERLTTAPGGPLRAEEVTRITAVLDGAQAAGVGVILNPWNFGAIWTDNGSGTSVRQPAGGSVFTKAVYADFWKRVITQWGDHPALIGADLMTEPVEIIGGAKTWEEYAQAATDAIRELNTRITIWVSPYGYGIDEISLHPRPWIRDTTGNYGYSGHQYNYNQGGSQTNYANALKSATDGGWTAGTETDALHAREVAAARAFSTWLAGNNGFISEYGIPQTEHTPVTDSTKWQSFLDRLLTEYDTLGFHGTIWNAGRVLNKDTLYSVYYPTGGYNTNINAGTSTATIIEKHQSKSTTPAYTPNPSNGTGGGFTDTLANTLTVGGVSSAYHLRAAHVNANSGAVPLVLHLHGDGYEEYTNMAAGSTTSVGNYYTQVARDAGAIIVIPRTPDTATGTWWEETSSTTWLMGLYANIISRYNIDLNRVFWSGYSGGAEEITYNVTADYNNRWTGGGAMILGGGGAEGLTGFAVTPTDTFKQNFPMEWHVGERDSDDGTGWSALNASAGGETFYKGKGFTTSRYLVPGADHVQTEPHGPSRLRTVINKRQTQLGLPTQNITQTQVTATSSASTLSTVTDKSIAAPTHKNGDLLIFFLTVYGSSAVSTAALPAGFTQIGSQIRASNHRLIIGTRTANNESTRYTPTIPSGLTYRGDILTVTGADHSKVGTPVLTVTTASTKHQAPSVTPTTTQGSIICAVSGAGGNAWAPDPWMVEKTDIATASPFLTLATAEQPTMTTNATGTKTFTASAGSYTHITATIYIPSAKS